jgi:hypothetical protein
MAILSELCIKKIEYSTLNIPFNMDQETQLLYEDLMGKISVPDQNETEISTLLNELKQCPHYKAVINRPAKSYNSDGETMLMWACWNRKLETVKELLAMGANPKYTNRDLDSVATYLRPGNDNNIVFEIAKLLHDSGVNLAQNSYHGYSIIKLVREDKIEPLGSQLRALGYEGSEFLEYHA